MRPLESLSDEIVKYRILKPHKRNGLNLHDKALAHLCETVGIDESHPEYNKFSQVINLVNQAYLKIALKEFESVRSVNPAKEVESEFNFLMALYNKHIREHQVMFLLFNIFETAIRSKAAVELSRKYSTPSEDDWLHDPELMPSKIAHTVSKAKEIILQDGEDSDVMDTFQIFDYILLGGLKSLYKAFWSDLSHLFEEKEFKGHLLSKIGKRSMETMMESIRKARNDNAHHKPFHKSRKRRHMIVEDIELILAHLNFNLADAVNNIDPDHKIIKLKLNNVH